MAGRTLFVSAFAPTLGSGRELRTYTVVRALAALGPVDLAFVPFGAAGPAPEYEALEGVAFHPVTTSRGLNRVRAYAAGRARLLPDEVARGASPELVDAVERLSSQPGRGRVVAGDVPAMAASLGVARRRPVIYNAHNVESAYRHAQNAARAYSWAAIRLLEHRILRRAAESWMVSHADVDRARRLAPRARLRYVPNVVDVDGIVPVPARAPRDTILMVGDFDYAPNRTGLRLLLDEVMPRVWAREPKARLRLVGRGLEDLTDVDPRIDVRGFVDVVAEAYDGADVAVVPLLESGGTPLKFVEALAYGVPVVATPLAASGLAVRPGEHFAEGDGPEAFASAVLGVLAGAHPALGARGRALAEREYSIETLVRLIAD